jgi:hypothetical protein
VHDDFDVSLANPNADALGMPGAKYVCGDPATGSGLSLHALSGELEAMTRWLLPVRFAAVTWTTPAGLRPYVGSASTLGALCDRCPTRTLACPWSVVCEAKAQAPSCGLVHAVTPRGRIWHVDQTPGENRSDERFSRVVVWRDT